MLKLERGVVRGVGGGGSNAPRHRGLWLVSGSVCCANRQGLSTGHGGRF